MKKILFAVLVAALVFLFVDTNGMAQEINPQLSNTATTTAPVVISDTEKEKYQVVDDLASKCETANLKYPDGAIVFDVNKKASIGAWQWQQASVIAYVKKFEGRTILPDEAARIALTRDLARELTYKTIWLENGGINNWKNCAIKLNLYERIEAIRSTEI